MTDSPVIAWSGADDLRTALVPIASLARFPGNPRRHDVKAIAESLSTLGQFRPITVNHGTVTGRPREILAGHGTTEAAETNGWTHIAVNFVDVDDVTARKIVAADNRTADLGRYDDEALAALLTSIVDAEADLTGTAYVPDDLDELLDLISYRDSAPLGNVDVEGQSAALRAEGVAPDAGFTGRTDTYAAKATRPIILDYLIDDYEAVAALLGAARDRAGVDTNSAAVKAALTAYAAPETPPDES